MRLVVALLKNSRKTELRRRQALRVPRYIWRPAAGPFALLKNSRKTDSLRLMESAGSSKYWRRAGAAFALLILALGACKRPDTLFVDPALLALVPADSVMLAGMKMEQVRETAIYKKYAGIARIKEPLDAFEKQTGIDPRKDLWEILIASNGKGKSVVLARGSFGGMGLEPTIDKPGIERSSYKGYMLFTKDDGGVVFLNTSTIAAGKVTVLRELLDSRNSNPPAPKEFLEKIKAIKSNNQVWAISLNGLPIPEGLIGGEGDTSAMTRNLMANLPRLLGSLKSSIATVDVSNGLHLSLDAECPTERDSKMLNDTLRGAIGIARLQVSDGNQETLKLLDAPKVTVTQTGVNLDVNYSNEDLTNLETLFSGKK